MANTTCHNTNNENIGAGVLFLFNVTKQRIMPTQNVRNTNVKRKNQRKHAQRNKMRTRKFLKQTKKVMENHKRKQETQNEGMHKKIFDVFAGEAG